MRDDEHDHAWLVLAALAVALLAAATVVAFLLI